MQKVMNLNEININNSEMNIDCQKQCNRNQTSKNMEQRYVNPEKVLRLD